MSCPDCDARPEKARFFKWLMPVGALVVVAAVASLTSRSGPVVSTEPGVVHVEVTDEGFTPSSVSVSPGEPLELEFLRTTEETCASSVAFPELGIRQPLALNEPVRIHVPASERRSLSFQCGVGDHRSAVIIN